MKKISEEKKKKDQRLLLKIFMLIMTILCLLFLSIQLVRVNVTAKKKVQYETNLNRITEIDYSK